MKGYLMSTSSNSSSYKFYIHLCTFKHPCSPFNDKHQISHFFIIFANVLFFLFNWILSSLFVRCNFFYLFYFKAHKSKSYYFSLFLGALTLWCNSLIFCVCCICLYTDINTRVILLKDVKVLESHLNCGPSMEQLFFESFKFHMNPKIYC